MRRETTYGWLAAVLIAGALLLVGLLAHAAQTTTVAPTTSVTWSVPLHQPPSAQLGVLPDPELTPGATDPEVRQSTIQQTICVVGYTATVRNVPQSEKRAVLILYRSKYPKWPTCAPGRCEYDHLISLELGGANDAANLWPESYDPAETGARAKDVIETKLHRLVCQGKVSLAYAQARIVKDWRVALDGL